MPLINCQSGPKKTCASDDAGRNPPWPRHPPLEEWGQVIRSGLALHRQSLSNRRPAGIACAGYIHREKAGLGDHGSAQKVQQFLGDRDRAHVAAELHRAQAVRLEAILNGGLDPL